MKKAIWLILCFTPVLFCESSGQPIEENMTHPTPKYLYKILSPSQWEESQAQKQVVVSAIDRNFIHLAKEDQVDHVAQKFWKGKEYVILKLASQKLIGNLVYETNPGGTIPYYHLYGGSILLTSVVEVYSSTASSQ